MLPSKLHSRRARYGSVTVLLTVTLIAALVLFNIIFSTLAARYGWRIDMTSEQLYSVSESCHALIADALERAEEKTGKEARVEIIFAENYEEYASGSAGSYIADTALELADRYEQVEVSWFNCWLDKTLAEQLGVRNAQSVVVRVGEESRVFSRQEFFAFETGNSTSPIGYDGERVFATTIGSLLPGERPMCYFTVNHDEKFSDQALLYLFRDAGYNVGLIDLYDGGIPADCDLLVTYNPNLDFIVEDGVSEHSELDRLEAYLAAGGEYMVFLSADTPVLPNFDAFLAEWGVSVLRGYHEATDRSYNSMVKDPSAALSADGFTILINYAEQGQGTEVLAPMLGSSYRPKTAFRDATALTVPAGFAAVGESSYVSGSRQRFDLVYAGRNATAWAGGKQLSTEGALPLLCRTEDSASGAGVTVCGSAKAFGADYVNSAVLGNRDTALCVLRRAGLEDVMIGLHYKPFTTPGITTLTTREMTSWTLWLTLTPAVLIAAVATVILVRRKYAK